MSKIQVAGIIPARGGSSGVPGKNLRLLAGRPLIWYTFQAARLSKLLTTFVVSTDNSEMEAYAKSENVPVLRHPASLSGDTSPTFPVVAYAFDFLESRHTPIDFCVTLRATSPLRTCADIDDSLHMLINVPDADSVVSVVEAIGIHPVRLKRMSNDGFLDDGFESEGPFPKRRQEFERLYLRNGAIYGAKRSVLKAGRMWGTRCLGYVMPEERSVNINTPFQFTIAEMLMENLNRCGPE